MPQIGRVLMLGACVTVVLLAVGLGIGSNVPLPKHAIVFLDDSAQTYMAAPCRAAGQFEPNTDPQALRMGTVGEARRLKYRPDRVCRNTGIHAPEGRSATGHLLQWLGLLPPIRHWWDDW